MNKSLIIYSLILLLLVTFVVSNYENPVNWTKTFSRYDKNPYGSFALSELAPDLFSGYDFEKNNLTFYEILNSDDSLANILSISESMYMESASFDKLLEQVSKGSTALISAQYFDYTLGDTLGFVVDYSNSPIYMEGKSADSAQVNFLSGDSVFFTRTELMTSLDSLTEDATVIMRNEFNEPVMASFPFGAGKIIVNTTPILFTNFFLLFENNSDFVAQMLNFLPEQNTVWTEYYQNGKFESNSPFREVLKYPALKNALHLTLLLLFLYLIFESKRAQRAIPVIKALPNMTLDFVKTLGSLYFHSHKPQAAAMNRINYFREFVMTKYNIRIHWGESDILTAKSGLNAELIDDLFKKMEWIERSAKIEVQALVSLDQQLNKFYKHTRHNNN